jgi:hypothetical protein
MRPEVAQDGLKKGNIAIVSSWLSPVTAPLEKPDGTERRAPIRVGSTRSKTKARIASVGRTMKPERETRKQSRLILEPGRTAVHRVRCPAAGARDDSTFEDHGRPQELSWPRKLA